MGERRVGKRMDLDSRTSHVLGAADSEDRAVIARAPKRLTDAQRIEALKKLLYMRGRFFSVTRESQFRWFRKMEVLLENLEQRQRARESRKAVA